MALPVLPHQDAAQVRMPFEADTHQVPGLALMEVGGRPNVDDGGYDGVAAIGQVDLDDEFLVGQKVEYMIDDLKALLFVVDSGQKAQVVETELIPEHRC